tara:strand:- start:709 stop:1266 length:558 start_codon:yes stop_codon:yes gene_type:complete
MLHRIVGVFILILVGVLLAYKLSPEFLGIQKPSQTATESPSSEILKPLDAEKLKEEIAQGSQKLTLVNLWASWCVPCLKEMPALVDLQKDLGDELRIVMISMDNQKLFPQVESVLKEKGVPFPTYLKGDRGYDEVEKIFPRWNGALPSNMILGPKGEILESWVGETTKEQFETTLKGHLEALRGT